ncbi:collagen alpha-2(VIII) chain-like [Mytilus californianus]|uniref:collagen alpha-2(VIII) chain-like n=1 Tax=Mytilus californianus TaxID=6549 RepID=UPI00224749E5|nr:collagen alpha-2(VIII) chain-like [Mytilus californianus]
MMKETFIKIPEELVHFTVPLTQLYVNNMMNLQVTIFSICMVLTLMLHDEVKAESCTTLERKIVHNLRNMMIPIKCGSQTMGVSDEKDRPAFTATLKSHLSLSNGAAITFDTVILNRGGGYNPKTGIFTAKKKGLYQISATVMLRDGIFYITKNEIKILSLYGPSLHGASETANPVLELEKGDNVSVKSYGSQKINGDYYSYFSAVYISE